ncbi:MAG: leucine-rich repeat domain-containing protein, partial [Clostridia bacterium]|nr:leucine-rich repeat domain-containing protein [Clostridia bacterium]
MKKICSYCGFSFETNESTYSCPACGALINNVLDENLNSLLAIASQKLRLADFDGAEEIYTSIIDKYPTCGEAYWGGLLSIFGIKYELDIDGSMVPTIYKTPTMDLRVHEYYHKALEYSDNDVADYYEKEAMRLELIRKEWIGKANKELNYDIFISYKHNQIKETSRARSIYSSLKDKKLDVFFSEESFKLKIGEKYEPYIMHAVDTCKCMIVYGKSVDEIESTWMKNEWLRYLKQIKNKQKQSGSLIVICDGFSAKDLPIELKSFQVIEAKDGEDFLPLLFEILKKNSLLGVKNKRIGYIFASFCFVLLLIGLILLIRNLNLPGENVDKSSENSINTLDTADVITSIENTITTDATTIETDVTIAVDSTTEMTINTNSEQTTVTTTEVTTEATTEVGLFEDPRYELISKDNSGYTILDNQDGIYYYSQDDKTLIACGLNDKIFKNSHSDGVLAFPSIIHGKEITSIEGFSGNGYIKEIYIPSSVKTIPSGAFQDTPNLKIVRFDDGVEEIQIKAFDNCQKLEKVELSVSLKEIGEMAFNNCISLKDIVLNEGLETIGYQAFSYCNSLSEVVIPSTVKQLAERAFWSCSNLSKVDFLTTKIKRMYCVFEDCESLTELILPEGLQVIETFVNIPNLKYVEIPSTIVRIERNTFINCNNIELVRIKG